MAQSCKRAGGGAQAAYVAVEGVAEAPAALLALERLLARVRPYVALCRAIDSTGRRCV
jgi:hypothetical protein